MGSDEQIEWLETHAIALMEQFIDKHELEWIDFLNEEWIHYRSGQEEP